MFDNAYTECVCVCVCVCALIQHDALSVPNQTTGIHQDLSYFLWYVRTGCAKPVMFEIFMFGMVVE